MTAEQTVNQAALKQELIRGFAWESLGKLGVQVVSWGSTILVARMVQPSDLGLVTLALLFTQFFDMMAEMGLAQSLAAKQNSTVEEEDSVFFFSVAIGLVLYVILYFAAPLIAHLYDNPDIVDIIRVLAVTSVLCTLRVVPMGKLLQQMDFRFRAKTAMISSVCAALTAATCAYHGLGPWTYIASTLVMQSLIVAMYLPKLGRIPRFRPRQLWAGADIIRYGMKLLTSDTLFYFYGRSPTFIAGKFVGAGALGQYAFANSLTDMPISKFAVIFSNVALPVFARLRDDRDQARTYFLTMHRYQLLVTYPLFAGFALVSDDLIALTVTTKWDMVATLLKIMSLTGMVAVSAMIPQNSLLIGLGRADLIARFNMTNMVMIPLGALIGVQQGLVVMACTLFLAYLPAYFLIMRYALREVGGTAWQLLGSAWPAVSGCAVMVAAVMLTRHFMADLHIVPRLAASILVGAGSYILALLCLHRSYFTEFREGLMLLRRKPD